MMHANVLPASHDLLQAAVTAASDPCTGVAIDVDASTDAPVYSVYLLTDEGRRARRVVGTTDQTAARRVWCLLARSLRVPRLVAEVEGGFRAVDVVFGAVVGRAAARRRGRRVALRRRSPSRRSKVVARPLAVHAGEREIVCYE